MEATAGLAVAEARSEVRPVIPAADTSAAIEATAVRNKVVNLVTLKKTSHFIVLLTFGAGRLERSQGRGALSPSDRSQAGDSSGRSGGGSGRGNGGRIHPSRGGSRRNGGGVKAS